MGVPQGSGQRRRRRSPNMVVVTLLVLVGTLLGGSAVLFGPQLVDDLLNRNETIGSSESEVGSEAEGPAQDALTQFAAALQTGDLSTVSFAGASSPGTSAPGTTSPDTASPETTGATATGAEPGAAAADFDELTRGLGSYELAVQTQPVVMVSDTAGQAPISLTWTFAGGLQWQTQSQVVLQKTDPAGWQVRWSPSILEPSLGPGDRLVRTKLPGQRASILGAGGAVLVDQSERVVIGVQPSRVKDLPSLANSLQDILGVDAGQVTADVQGAKPDDFVEIATLPKADYDKVRDQVFPLSGTVFRTVSTPQPIYEGFARALLGRSGEVTADIIQANPGLFEAGDIVGLSGLQGKYNSVLAGKPGLEIGVKRAAPAAGGSTTTVTGLTTTSAIRDPDQAETLFRIEPTAGQPVQTTIDPRVQKAAEDALARVDPKFNSSALVAVQVSTGNVLAVANGPKGNTVNNAMVGQYPPGSTFKVVSGYAVVRDAQGPDDPVDCPGNVTIEGTTIGNAENEVFGTIPFHTAFAHSCNTAFINATRGFDFNVLHDTAAQFGLGAGYDLGLDAFDGDVPVNNSKVDLASSAFGQGRILVSPLSEAVMAATAAGGVYRSPQLVTSPAPATPQVTAPLDGRADGILQQMMREVVTDGTGRAVANVAGGPVSGKTGTAEFGTDVPLKSHAWFVGYQGDIAFVVFVEAGEFGGLTSAPIAAVFLNDLASG